MVEMFAKMRRGKNAVIKGIHFLQSILNITDKHIIKQLEDIPLFETDSNLVRVTNLLVITYIAHKLRAEYLWQRFLNYIVPKYFCKGIYNLALKRLFSYKPSE